jgi:N-formylglutamate amidohydrolase
VNYACESGETLANSTDFEVVSLFPWDITKDGCVGIDDLFAVAMHFGAERNQANYDALCDINHDGCIDISDIFAVAQHFGRKPIDRTLNQIHFHTSRGSPGSVQKQARVDRVSIQKGYMLLVRFWCICGCLGMQGDRQIQS